MEEGDKLLYQVPAMATPALTDYYYAVNSDGTIQGKVTAQQMKDLFAAGGNNLKTVAYTIGVPGVTNVDYNFTSAADHAEQSIQLGGAAIIPANSQLMSVIVRCQTGLNGAATGVMQLGTASGGNQIADVSGFDDTDEIHTTLDINMVPTVSAKATAFSIYFSYDPDTNWNTLTTGTFKVWISYIDNSVL